MFKQTNNSIQERTKEPVLALVNKEKALNKGNEQARVTSANSRQPVLYMNARINYIPNLMGQTNKNLGLAYGCTVLIRIPYRTFSEIGVLVSPE